MATSNPTESREARQRHALVEAQVMSESIRAIANVLVGPADAESFPLLEAILACTHRIDSAVDPVLDDLDTGQ
jgi:hypothetical protein